MIMPLFFFPPKSTTNGRRAPVRMAAVLCPRVELGNGRVNFIHDIWVDHIMNRWIKTSRRLGGAWNIPVWVF